MVVNRTTTSWDQTPSPLLISACCLLLWLCHIEDKGNDRARIEEKDGRRGDRAVDPSIDVGSHLPPATGRSKDRKREKKEESYWWISKVGSALGGIGAVTAAGFAYYAFKEAHRQADIAQEGVRPWISVHVTPTGPVVSGLEKTEVGIQYQVDNPGHSPALSVAIHAEVRPYLPGGPVPLEEDVLCKGERDYGPFSAGRLLFPDEKTLDQQAPHFLSTADIRKVVPGGTTGQYLLVVVGCVTYRILGDTESHQTPFIYKLFRSGPADPTKVLNFDFRNGVDLAQGGVQAEEVYVSGRDPN